MTTIFILLTVYQLKHFLADFPLQGKFMLGKFKGGTDWILPLLAHVGVHGVFTFLIVLCVKPEYATSMMILDMTIHFIMDRIKASPNLLGRFKNFTAKDYNFITAGLSPPKFADIDYTIQKHPEDIYLQVHPLNDVEKESVLQSNRCFWLSLGIDQGVHHLTHYLIIWFIVS